MLTEVTENTQTFQMPTLGEKITQALPIPVSPTEVRRRMIAEIAEELHPGNWCLGDPEDEVHKLFHNYAPKIGGRNCKCDHCTGGYPSRCENNNNREKTKRLIIRIPETTIRNSRGESHFMEDFYVVMGLKEDYSKALTTQLFSMRSTVTTEEYAYGAFHPHSRHTDQNSRLNTYFSWRDMCLGGDTELTDIMYTLFSDGVSKKPLFEYMLLLHIYAGWESIEGGPYRQMRNYKYPRNEASSRTHFDQDGIYQGFLKVMASTDDIPRPEIIGVDKAMAISNASSSMVPAIKASMVSRLDPSQHDEQSIRGIYAFLGTNDNGQFTPLFNTSGQGSTQKSRAWYESKVAETVQWSAENADRVLKFQGGITFVMKLKEEGLGETQTDPTAEQIEHATVHPEVVRLITYKYLDNLRTFKFSHKF